MQTTTLLRPPEPSCLPSAPAITNFFPPHLIPIHLFLFPRPPSLISTPLRLPSVVSLPPLSLLSFSLSSSSRRFVSSVSRLSTSLSTPISLASSYLSLSLSGVEEAEYHLEKMAFLQTCRCSHTHTHTLENTLKLARLSIVSQCVAVAWWAAAKLDVIKCNWCSELEKRE